MVRTRLLALALCLGLTACGTDESTDADAGPTPDTATAPDTVTAPDVAGGDVTPPPPDVGPDVDNPCLGGAILGCDGATCIAANAKGDGTCLPALDCVLHDFDGGDCCTDEQVLGCDFMTCVDTILLGNGTCDELLRCPSFDWDQGDCCIPACEGKACGDDGCGGDCGTCDAGLTCDAADQCICAPDCAGKDCGPDGCGGVCGTCDEGLACDVTGQCICAPACEGKQCGDDGCGGDCGTCDAGLMCGETNQCVCAPDCAGKDCGPDGCGGVCGEPFFEGNCGSDATCDESGQCECSMCQTWDPDGGCYAVSDYGPYCTGTTVTECYEGEDHSFDCPNGCDADDVEGWCLSLCGDGVCEGGPVYEPWEHPGECPEDCPCEEDPDFLAGCEEGSCDWEDRLGDGTCDDVFNCAELDYDGGDCCLPACEGKACGDDGCGDVCGTCGDGLTCGEDGQCGCPEGTVARCPLESVYGPAWHYEVEKGWGEPELAVCAAATLLGDGTCQVELSCHDGDGGDCCQGQIDEGWLSTCVFQQAGVDGMFDGTESDDCDFPAGAWVPGCDGESCAPLDSQGDGSCNSLLNCKDFDYDGGDCCAADCEGKECGPDGCGGFCGNPWADGDCDGVEPGTCTASGQCDCGPCGYWHHSQCYGGPAQEPFCWGSYIVACDEWGDFNNWMLAECPSGCHEDFMGTPYCIDVCGDGHCSWGAASAGENAVDCPEDCDCGDGSLMTVAGCEEGSCYFAYALGDGFPPNFPGTCDAVFNCAELDYDGGDCEPPTLTLAEQIQALLVDDLGFDQLTISLDITEIEAQAAAYPGPTDFMTALDLAMTSFLTDDDDIESPLGIASFVAEATWTEDNPEGQTFEEATRAALIDHLNRPTASISLVPIGQTAEHGEPVDANWVFFLTIDELSDHLYWAIVDRQGVVATYNYGFN